MNDDHQIAAESRQIFWTNLHQNFTRCRGISVVINPCIYKAMLHFIWKFQSTEWRRSILTSAKRSQSYSVTIERLFKYCKNYFSFIICIQEPTKAEKLLKFGPVLAEIFGMICRFLPSRPKSYRNSLRDLCA